MMKHLIPKKEYPILEIDGKKYFWLKNGMQIQCAKCLYLFFVQAEKNSKTDVVQLYFEDEKCHCDKKILKNDE